MAGNRGRQTNNDELVSWIIVVVALVVFWPVGLFLLFRKLTQSPGQSRTGSRHPYDIRQQEEWQSGQTRQEPGTQGVRQNVVYHRDGTSTRRQVVRRQPVQSTRHTANTASAPATAHSGQGRGLIVGGGVLAGLFGFISFTEILNVVDGLLHGYSWWSLEEIFVPLGLCGVGLVLLSVGLARSRKAKRFRKYLALIGRQKSIWVENLAQAMPVPMHTACDDLQEMLDKGILPMGYLDMGSGRLILTDEGLQAEPETTEPKSDTDGEDERILAQIRAVNDAIEDEEMSRKIDRIEEITRKIFAYQKKNPEKAGQLRSFLNYYLPTTLKILNAYAQMEEQGVEGANITAAKVRIEGMMDKVVEGYEKQLDRLFENQAMDITTDVQVLEQMLEKDGLSQQWEGLTLNG